MARETVEATFDSELNQPVRDCLSLMAGRQKSVFAQHRRFARCGIHTMTTHLATGRFITTPIIYRHFISLLVTTQLLTLIAFLYHFPLHSFGRELQLGVPTAYRLNVDTVGGMGSTVAVLQALMEGTNPAHVCQLGGEAMKYAGLGAPEPLITACVAIVVCVALLLVVRSITKKR